MNQQLRQDADRIIADAIHAVCLTKRSSGRWKQLLFLAEFDW